MGEMTTADRLALYRLLVEQANFIAVARRETTRFFLTFNTAVFGGFGLVYSDRVDFPMFMLFVAAFGMAMVCFLWSSLVQYYGRVATAKFQVIFEVEKHFDLQPFRLEEQKVLADYSGWSFSASRLESYLPIIFALAYLGVAIHAATVVLT
ncbi:MAG: hypothetical protein NW206_10290 [Hyphomonadaceae bacterium]|nr:hypothetical protein [Hyphomonadaceae bacterium]